MLGSALDVYSLHLLKALAFGRPSTTSWPVDLYWDRRGRHTGALETVNAAYRAVQVNGPIDEIRCERLDTSKPHNWITLSWDKPDQIADQKV